MSEALVGIHEVFPTIEERSAFYEEQRRQAFARWQQTECQLYGLTVEEHNKVLEVAEKLQAAAPWADAYSAIMSWLRLQSPLSKLGIQDVG